MTESPQINANTKEHLEERQQKQMQYYNRGTISLPPLPPGDVVCYKTDLSGSQQ